MNRSINRVLKLTFVGVMIVGILNAQTPSSDPQVIKDTMKLIDIAGKQRMLSQRIAKDYLYLGEKVAISKSQKQLKSALDTLKNGHETLVKSINDEEIRNLLAFVEMGAEDFVTTSKEPFSVDNAQLIIDLSESMLEGSQYVVNSLKASIKLKESNIVAISGKQRMLAQRIAKYYIAYQAGIKDQNTIRQMNEAVENFKQTHEKLMSNQDNTPQINKELNSINRLWKIVYKFYLNIEKGGLPLIVFNTTDDITKKMDKITGLYVKLYQ
jgi:hypothetical protein